MIPIGTKVRKVKDVGEYYFIDMPNGIEGVVVDYCNELLEVDFGEEYHNEDFGLTWSMFEEELEVIE